MSEMNDEEIIKRRLLIDADGTGDDRRLNILLKQFLKWCLVSKDAQENNQIIFDRLLAQLAQCTFAVTKSHKIYEMIKDEITKYAEFSNNIDHRMEEVKREIEESKCELATAKWFRKNRMEYDMLARLIIAQPDRKESMKQLELLKIQLADLHEEHRRLSREMYFRHNDFHVVMHAVFELQEQFEKGSSDDDVEEPFLTDSADELCKDEVSSSEDTLNCTAGVNNEEGKLIKGTYGEDEAVMQSICEKDKNAHNIETAASSSS